MMTATTFAPWDRVRLIGPHLADHLVGRKATVLEEHDGHDHLGNQHYVVRYPLWVGHHRTVLVANLHFVHLSAVDRLAELA